MKDAMLITHFIGLAMVLGASFAFLFLGSAGAKLQDSERLSFMKNIFSLSKMGNIGLVLSFLSGGYLMTPYWGSLSDRPLLMAKLVLFIVLGGLIGMLSAKMRKLNEDNAEQQAGKIKTMGRVALLTGLVIVVLAVSVFH